MRSDHTYGLLLSAFVHVLMLALQVSVYLLLRDAATSLAQGYYTQLYFCLGATLLVLVVLYVLIRWAARLCSIESFAYGVALLLIAGFVLSGPSRLFLDRHVYRSIPLPEQGVVLSGDELVWYQLSDEKSFSVRSVNEVDRRLALKIIYQDGDDHRLEKLSFRKARQLGDWEIELKNYNTKAQLDESSAIVSSPVSCTIICEQTLLSEDCDWSCILFVALLGVSGFVGTVYGVGKSWPQKSSILMFCLSGGLSLYCFAHLSVRTALKGYEIETCEDVSEHSCDRATLLGVELTPSDLNASSYTVLLRDDRGEEGGQKELLIGEDARVGDVHFRIMNASVDGESVAVCSRLAYYPLLDAIVMSLFAALYLAMIGRYARCLDQLLICERKST